VESVTSLQEMASEIATATVELSATAGQISSDILVIEHVSEETVKSASAIASESDALAGISIELRSEIGRFTHKGQQASDSKPAGISDPEDTGGRMSWFKPSANCAA